VRVNRPPTPCTSCNKGVLSQFLYVKGTISLELYSGCMVRVNGTLTLAPPAIKGYFHNFSALKGQSLSSEPVLNPRPATPCTSA
jgi:hypothetical protein